MKSNCETLTERVSEFLDNQLQPPTKKGLSYITDLCNFINNKIRKMGSIPDNAILVTSSSRGIFFCSLLSSTSLKALNPTS